MDISPRDDAVTPSKPKLVKSLLKGLGCLALVNSRNGVSVVDAALQLRLPKSTAYRILETLCRGGYAVREPDGLYRATSLVRSLSAGFHEEEWVRTIAHPELVALGRTLVWGLGLATPEGLSMHLRETTDRDSPLAVDRWIAGTRLPLDCSGAGHLYLAYLPERERTKCIEALSHGPLRADSPLHNIGSFITHLARVREKGFAINQATEREAAVTVPILFKGRFIACIGMHFLFRVLSEQTIEAEFVPPLRGLAERIQARLIEENYDFGDV